LLSGSSWNVRFSSTADIGSCCKVVEEEKESVELSRTWPLIVDLASSVDRPAGVRTLFEAEEAWRALLFVGRARNALQLSRTGEIDSSSSDLVRLPLDPWVQLGRHKRSSNVRDKVLAGMAVTVEYKVPTVWAMAPG